MYVRIGKSDVYKCGFVSISFLKDDVDGLLMSTHVRNLFIYNASTIYTYIYISIAMAFTEKRKMCNHTRF